MRRRLHQRAAQKHLRQKAAQANYRVDGSGHQRGGHGVDFRHDDDVQVLRLLGDVGAALHQHSGVDALHLQVIGAGYAFGQRDVAAHKVKGKALAKHVAKIQRQPPWQRLQAEHAEQFGQPRFGLQKLAGLKVEVDLPIHAGVVRAERRAAPTHLTAHLAFAAADDAGHAKALQQRARVVDVEVKAQLSAPLCAGCASAGVE